MAHQFNLNRPPHLIANEVLRQLENLLSENGTHVRLEGRFHDLITGLIEQYQNKLGETDRVQETPVSAVDLDPVEKLKVAGYKVEKTGFGWSPVNPRGYSIIRGWTQTEQEAWELCQEDFEN